jgi:hypothetical protein
MAKKYRGNIRVTAELLHSMLHLPNEVEIINVVFDNKRELINIIIRSNEEVEHLTLHTGESMEFPSANVEFYFGDEKNA